MKLLPISIVEINCLLWKFLNKKITALSITNSYINKTLLHILGDVEDGEFLVKSINCPLTVMIYGREFFGAKRKKNYFKYCNLELGDPN